jgi:MraZ protein
MLRGNAIAKVDEKGRLKLPSSYRSLIEPAWGSDFFVTSLRGESVLVYPLPIFAAAEERVFGPESTLDPSLLQRTRDFINYFGQAAKMDPQGRILIHPLLRQSARINGEVAVFGRVDHLEVWNREIFEERMRGRRISDEEAEAMSRYGF